MEDMKDNTGNIKSIEELEKYGEIKKANCSGSKITAENVSGSDLTEKFVSSKEVFNGRLLKVFSDTVRLPNGKNSIREYIKHNGAVCIVPLTDRGQVIMEKQFRYPLQRLVTEIPAGKLDSATEDPLEAAKRELSEETGYTALEWTFLGCFFPSVAYTTECIYMYLAQSLVPGRRHLDSDEFLNTYTMPFSDVVKEIEDGNISDGKTVSAILKAKIILDKKGVKYE